MRFVKITAFFLFVFLLTALNTIVVCNAGTYTDSYCGATFTIPDTWHEESWRLKADVELKVYGYRDGCVVYSAEFVPDRGNKYDYNIRFGYKDLMRGASSSERARYQTADFIAEIESLRSVNSRITATSDEAKRVITDAYDKSFLSQLGSDEHEMMMIGALEYARFDENDSHIYIHVHNGVVYQFKEKGAKEEIKELLASANFPGKAQIKPSEATAKKRSNKSSGISFKAVVYILVIIIILVTALIKRIIVKVGKKTKVISIRMAYSDNDGDYDEDSDAEEDSTDTEID